MQIFLSRLEELPLHLCCLWVRCPMSSVRRWWKVCLTVLSAVCLCWTPLSSLALSTLSSAPSQKEVHVLLCCSVALSLQNVLQNEIYWKTFCISISCTYNSRLLYLWNTPGSEYSYFCECPFSHGISVNMILWFSIYTLSNICMCPSSALPSRRACFATVLGTLVANQWSMILHVGRCTGCLPLLYIPSPGRTLHLSLLSHSTQSTQSATFLLLLLLRLLLAAVVASCSTLHPHCKPTSDWLWSTWVCSNGSKRWLPDKLPVILGWDSICTNHTQVYIRTYLHNIGQYRYLLKITCCLKCG